MHGAAAQVRVLNIMTLDVASVSLSDGSIALGLTSLVAAGQLPYSYCGALMRPAFSLSCRVNLGVMSVLEQHRVRPVNFVAAWTGKV